MAKKITVSVNGSDPVDVTGRLEELTFSEKELKEVQETIADILETNWTGIQKMISETESNTGSVSISVTLDHSGPSRAVKIKIGYAVKHSDESEFVVRDPAQTEIKF